jgi:hypothetical protein
MDNLEKYMLSYQKQLRQGDIKKAYRGLMTYLNQLRHSLDSKHPNFVVSDSVQPGTMDVSYFYFFPKQMKQLKLKVVIVFVHETFTFEAWLSGVNKSAQAEHWSDFSKIKMEDTELAPTPTGEFYLLKRTLVNDANFKDLDALSQQVETNALNFIDNIEAVLAGAA